MNSEETLCYLGILVEHGKKTLIDAFREYGYSNPEEAAEQEVNKILLMVPEQRLFNDKDFSLSLSLGLLRIFEEDRVNFKSNFLGCLLEIFPRPLAEKLYEYALGLAIERVKKPLEFRREEIHLLYEKRRKIVFSVVKSLNKSRPPTTGTESILVPCPQCGLKKRCFQNTKRFRCSQCGYENPNYRYPSAL